MTLGPLQWRHDLGRFAPRPASLADELPPARAARPRRLKVALVTGSCHFVRNGVARKVEAMPSDQVKAFWASFREHAWIDHDDYVVVAFGDSPAMANELAELVLAATKRATVCLARDVASGAESAPVVDGFVVMIDGAGAPQAIWRTTEVRLGRLDSVDAAFAWDEGEGERTRQDWLDGHRRYFARQAARDGFDMHDGIETWFERFEIVWPLSATTAPR